ncbi:MAG: nucleoside hydrolase [Bacteroidota bacterium]|nr:nucleoside hydrolase [Bacteroidota bacterium]
MQRILSGLFLLLGLSVNAQIDSSYYRETIKPRMRIIVDNDFGGDPDGLFQLAHQILSPSAEIKGIVASQHYSGKFYGAPGTATYAMTQLNELLNVMQLNGKFQVYEGSNTGLTDIKTPAVTDAAKAIVKEAMREDSKSPLYVVCGAGLTTIASAYLLEPKIADKIILVWIGGAEYQGLAVPPPTARNREYNLGIDIKAAQVIFNVSNIPVWQVPRDAYRQALYSCSEIVTKIKSNGATGKFLVDKLDDLLKRSKGILGEAYVLGDSPLVLLTALQASWDPDPSSCKYAIKRAPLITDSGIYKENPDGRNIRVYTNLDTRLMFDDLVAKLTLFSAKK